MGALPRSWPHSRVTNTSCSQGLQAGHTAFRARMGWLKTGHGAWMLHLSPDPANLLVPSCRTSCLSPGWHSQFQRVLFPLPSYGPASILEITQAPRVQTPPCPAPGLPAPGRPARRARLSLSSPRRGGWCWPSSTWPRRPRCCCSACSEGIKCLLSDEAKRIRRGTGEGCVEQRPCLFLSSMG